jgi:methionine aminopeptidase
LVLLTLLSLVHRSVNEVICHGIPDARKLEDGDIVNVDVTVYYKGVHGDLNETYFVGDVDEASKQLVRCTYECLEKAIAIVKPGVRFREVGEIINRHASMSGLSVVSITSASNTFIAISIVCLHLSSCDYLSFR